MSAESDSDGKVADAPRGNWVDRFLPSRARPYARLARLDRPIGWWLLMWPCWWSTMLAMDSVDGSPLPVLPILILFMIGAIVMRGAGCTFNDIIDRKIDAQVARTRSRPIPSGQVSVVGALVFMVVLGLIGLLVLIQFDSFTILLGMASLATVVIYPFLKRFTNWPQIGLGISFSWGALMGWSALFGDIDPPAIILYVGCICWVIGYDTIYALQDKEDDTLAGVRSTARLFGDHAKRLIVVSFACATALFAVAFFLAEAEIAAFVGLALGAIHFVWQVRTLDTDDPERCLRIFRSNRDYGWILFAGLVVDAALTGR
jgi:4-hydroxybenzoate polyprenyltransferase